MKIFNVSNYYEQSRGLPKENDFQIMTVKLADYSTYARELTKVVAVAGLVTTAVCFLFNSDPTIPLICTTISGIGWLLTRTCAQRLEPQAQDMIKHFRALQAERANEMF